MIRVHSARFKIKYYIKTCVKRPLSNRPKIVFQGEHSAILLTGIKLPIVIKIFVLSIFEWLFHTGFTVSFKTNAVNILLQFVGR